MNTTILIIEDEPTVLDNVAEILELEGFDTLQSLNGGEGLSVAREHKPDLIVCDIMMPMMDGFDTLKRLRSEPEISQIPFVFLTAKVADEDKRLGRELGADDYLTKPFTRDGLIKAIRLRLGKHHALSGLQQERQQKTARGSRRSQAMLMRIAAVEGDLATLRRLIAEVDDVDMLDDQGNSALMFAIMMRNEEAARLLIKAGASTELKHRETGLTINAMARSMGLRNLTD
ncbi:response regulator [Natronospirillum operosum]|uniref:Response regulator n=1 Tax=Natronospirillum operosum TaxID=2759953 RepID=A0A4Z0WBK9_9GAMM|nr:response regulator [Natronospirillum operosum]TGG93303.1 response regulator [Natronospirillum operosum]